MNDYIETPEGTRVRYLRPSELDRGKTLLDGGRFRPLGVAHIDAMLPPEPPEAA